MKTEPNQAMQRRARLSRIAPRAARSAPATLVSDLIRSVKKIHWLSLTSLLIAGCVLCPPSVPSKASPTGGFGGLVLDSAGKPVSGADVSAVYSRNWTTILPPVPNQFVLASTKTDRTGYFELRTNKKISWIAARHGRLSGSSRDLQEPNRISLTLH